MINFLINDNNYIYGYFSIQINFLFWLGILLFSIGLFGVIYSIERLIVFLMCVELMWLGVGICFLSMYLHFSDVYGLIFALVILSIAAAESAIGLALIVNYYRLNNSINLKYLTNLRG